MLKVEICLLRRGYFYRKLESIMQWLRAVGPNCPTNLNFLRCKMRPLTAPVMEGYCDQII